MSSLLAREEAAEVERATGAADGERPDRRLRIALPLLALLLANVLVFSSALSPLRGPATLAVALVLPGTFALRALRVTAPRGWAWMLYAVALSLAGLLLTAGVICLVGVRLTTLSCVLGLDVLVAILAVAAAFAPPPVRRSRPRVRITPLAGLAPLLGLGAVACTALGATMLNADGGGTRTALGLVLATACLGMAAAAARRHPEAAATAVYLLSLAVLLATSLRGAAVTGHDIKLEYRVFAEVLESGRWQPQSTFGGYNSCLSITLLPTFLARLSGVAALDVFRVCFQALFAVVPVGVFLLARRFVPAPGAVLAAGLFVAFPTFVNDMPMLNRQEIALIFFTVLMLIVTSTRGPVPVGHRRRAILLGVMVGGLTVSHYSTTYVAVALLLGAWVVRQLRRSARHDLPALHGVLGGCGAALLAATISWASLTGSASELGRNLATAADTLIDQISSGGRGFALVPASEASGSEQTVLDRHLARLQLPPHPALGCAPVAEAAEMLPVTPLGALIDRAGVAPGQLNAALRLGTVVVFEGGAVLGVMILLIREWRRRSRRRRAPTALIDLSVAAITLLAVPILGQNLSASYGPQRLYQQLLVVLWFVVLVALRAATAPRRAWSGVHPGRRGDHLTGIVVLVCLLSTCGLVPQGTGGYPPQLNLNNSGPFYDAYYASEDDRRMAQWIRGNLRPDAQIVADGRDSLNVRAMTALDPGSELFPGGIPDTSYLLARTSDGLTVSGLLNLPDRTVRYHLPIRCVAADRPLLHAWGPLRLYGPRL
jgi:hypothetical protein